MTCMHVYVCSGVFSSFIDTYLVTLQQGSYRLATLNVTESPTYILALQPSMALGQSASLCFASSLPHLSYHWLVHIEDSQVCLASSSGVGFLLTSPLTHSPSTVISPLCNFSH